MLTPVFAQNGADTGENPETTISDEPADSNEDFAGGPSCNLTSLSREEVQKIKDEILIPGTSIDELSSGIKKDDPEQLRQKSAILTNRDSTDAAKIDIPSYKIDSEQAGPVILDKHFTGAFSIAMVLDDTLRVGRCLASDRNESCKLDYPYTTLRNSGTGIVSNFKLAGKGVVEDIIGSDYFTEKQKEELEARVEMEAEPLTEDGEYDVNADVNAEKQVRFKTGFRRTDLGEVSVIESSNFSSTMGTNCEHASCEISLYSLFDKYFNSMFSAEIVISTAGPTLYNRAGKLWDYASKRNVFPFNLQRPQFIKNMESTLYKPRSYLGEVRIARLKARADRYDGVKDAQISLIHPESSYPILQGGGFDIYIKNALKPDGVIGKIKDPKIREELVKEIADYEAYYRVMKSMADNAAAVAKKEVASGVPESVAKINHARKLSELMDWADDDTLLDTPEYFMRNPEFGLKGLAFYDTEKKIYIDATAESNTMDPHFFRPFQKEGKWTSGNTPLRTDDSGNLVAYKFNGRKFFGEIEKDGLDQAIAEGAAFDKVVQLRDGSWAKITADNKDYILKNTDSPLKVFELGAEELDYKMTPELLANKLLDEQAYSRMFASPERNAKKLRQTLVERNYAARRYTSVLDKQLAQEAELIKTYFKPTGGLKYTVLPYAYWWARKGLEFDDLSAYQLPETWTKAEMYPRATPLYDDAYIDFFANAGSDQGDIFQQVLQYMPWDMVYSEISELYQPINDVYNRLSGETGRDEVDNLIFYMYGQKECAGCSMTLQSPDYERFFTGFYTPKQYESFMIEERLEDELKGALIIAFAHHTDLKGESGAEGVLEKEAINLQKAIEEKKTCRDISKDIAFGFEVNRGVGALYAGLESISYAVFGLPAIFGSFALQTLILPELQDCVDSEEGYYLHFAAPIIKEKVKKANPTEAAAEKLGNAAKDVKDDVVSLLQGNPDSEVTKKIEDVGDELNELAGNVSEPIVQAFVKYNPVTTGTVDGVSMFYFWREPTESNKAFYNKQGQLVMKGLNADGNEMEIVMDNETGKMLVNGEEIIDSETGVDHVRMSSDNLEIPAQEIPQKLAKARLTGNNKVFEINVGGGAKVLDSAIKECIQEAVMDQTGLPWDSDDLIDVFGKVTTVVSDSHPQIIPDSLQNKIFAEGSPRHVIDGQDSKINIYGNANVEIANEDKNVSYKTGRLNSIQFENGVMVYKPETQELIIWLKRHAKGILSKEDVQGLKPELTSVTNPETNCPEPAIKLEAIGDLDSPRAMANVESFNKSLEHLGPFQIFDTEKKTYIFYSKLLEDGTCEDRFRIIDKETGEVYDQAIQPGTMKQEGNKVEFQTDDGQDHSLEFSAEDGKPMLNYNGESEVLQSAQGPNGSFWYDPDKGLWHAENAQLIPLNDLFKQQGMEFKGGSGGEATATSGDNVLIFNEGEGIGNIFANLPSLPENMLYLFLFVVSLAGSFILVRRKIELIEDN